MLWKKGGANMKTIFKIAFFPVKFALRLMVFPISVMFGFFYGVLFKYNKF